MFLETRSETESAAWPHRIGLTSQLIHGTSHRIGAWAVAGVRAALLIGCALFLVLRGQLPRMSLMDSDFSIRSFHADQLLAAGRPTYSQSPESISQEAETSFAPLWTFGGASRALAIDPTKERLAPLHGSGLSLTRMLSSEPERSSIGLPGPVYAIHSLRDNIVLVAAGEAGLMVLRDIGPESPGLEAEDAQFEHIATLKHPDGHSILDIAAVDQTVYLAAQTGGLLVVDMQDPEEPSVLSTVDIPLGAQVTDLKISALIAPDEESPRIKLFAATGVTGLRVFDLEEPSSPREIESAAIELIDDFPLNVEVMALNEGQELLLLSDGPRTHVFRSADGIHRRIATIETEQRYAKAVALNSEANKAAILSIDLLNSKAELSVYGLEDPSQPAQIRTLDFGEVLAGLFEAPRPRMELLFDQDRLWAAVGSQGLWSLDLSQENMPAEAQPANALTWPEAAVSTSLNPDSKSPPSWMLIAGGENGVFSTTVVDQPRAPAQIFATEGFTNDLLLDASTGRLYVADGAGGLLILQAEMRTADLPASADWSRSPRQLGHLELPGAVQVERYKEILYVVDAVLGLAIVDASDPAVMIDLGRIDLGFDFPEAVRIVDESLLIAHGRSLSVFDLREPAKPVLIARLDLPDFARDLEADGTDVFIALSDTGVGQIDLSDPKNPRLSNQTVGSESTPGSVQALLVTDDQVFAAMGSAGVGRFERRPLAENETKTSLHWIEDDSPVSEAVGLGYDGWRVWLCARGDGLLVYPDPLVDPPVRVEFPNLLLPFLGAHRP